MISDAYPLAGYHKASYILVTACIGTTALFFLATLEVRHPLLTPSLSIPLPPAPIPPTPNLQPSLQLPPPAASPPYYVLSRTNLSLPRVSMCCRTAAAY